MPSKQNKVWVPTRYQRHVLDNMYRSAKYFLVYTAEYPDFYKDRIFLIKILHANGLALEYFPAEFQDDLEMAMAALKNNGNSAEFIGQTLKKDRVFVLKAIDKRGWTLSWFSDFLDDEEVVLKAVKDYPYIMGKASNRLKSDIPFILEAMREHFPYNQKKVIKKTAPEVFNLVGYQDHPYLILKAHYEQQLLKNKYHGLATPPCDIIYQDSL
jgi:hypothetical protein